MGIQRNSGVAAVGGERGGESAGMLFARGIEKALVNATANRPAQGLPSAGLPPPGVEVLENRREINRDAHDRRQ